MFNFQRKIKNKSFSRNILSFMTVQKLKLILHKKFSTINKTSKSETRTSPNLSNKTNKEETIFLFSHGSAKNYYKLNVLPLFIYLGICFSILILTDVPDQLKKTMRFFGTNSFLLLLAISFYSKRHINHLSLTKPGNIILMKTFSKLGLGKFNEYQIPLKDIGPLIPISKYIRTKKTGIYILKPSQDIKYFYFMNFFFIRPTSNPEFDKLFKNKIQKLEN
jgi:hypothetical protein